MRVLSLLLLLACAAPAGAQPTAAADLLRAMREATARLDYPAAEARAREALARPDGLSPDELVEVHAALGTVLHARGATTEARDQFRAALSLNPSLTLDPVLVSPLTLQLLEDVRAEVSATPTRAPTTTVRYVVLPDRRPGAALRSAVLPGWGQFHKGDRRRGWAFAVGVGAAAAGTVATHFAYRGARARYLDARTPDEAEAAYGPMNRLYHWRSALGVATAAGWVLAVGDALATGAPRPPGETATLAPAPGGLALRIRL